MAYIYTVRRTRRLSIDEITDGLIVSDKKLTEEEQMSLMNSDRYIKISEHLNWKTAEYSKDGVFSSYRTDFATGKKIKPVKK